MSAAGLVHSSGEIFAEIEARIQELSSKAVLNFTVLTKKREILQEEHVILWKLLKLNDCYCLVGEGRRKAGMDGASWAR